MLVRRPSSIAQDAHALMNLVRAGLYVLPNLTFSRSLSPSDMPICQISYARLHISHPPCNINTHHPSKNKTPKTPQKICPLHSFPFTLPSHPRGSQQTHSNSNLQLPPRILHPLLNPKPSLRLPQLLHLRVRQALLDFLHIDQLFYGEDLTGDVGRDGVVDGAHALVQAEGFEHAAGFARQADGGAHEGHAEEGCCCWGGHG